MGDSAYGPDPYETVNGDRACNTRYNVGGDVAFDVIDESLQEVSWDILHAFTQDISWHIFEPLYAIQCFIVKALCFEYGIKDPVQFNSQVLPINFDFVASAVLNDTVSIKASPVETFTIKRPVQYTFSVQNDINFTFGVK